MPHRIAFYCHQLRGLGHVALSLRLAGAVARDPAFSVAVLTGSMVSVAAPAGVRMVALPIVKEPLYQPPAFQILQTRAGVIRDFCCEWQPDCFIVDQVPLGIGAELVKVLETATVENWKTLFALGVSYCEGLPEGTTRNPKMLRSYAKYSVAIGYQSEAFEPVLEALPFLPGLKYKKYLGVAAPVPTPPVPRHPAELCKRVVVLCGGGAYHTSEFIDLVIAACQPWLESRQIQLTCVAGPLAENITFRSSQRKLPGVIIETEGRAEDWVGNADVVVARCGYSTAFTVIQGHVPVVFVPTPGQESEQINRARKLARLDRVWSVEEAGNGTCAELKNAIAAALDAPRGPRPLPFETNGSDRLAGCLNEILHSC